MRVAGLRCAVILVHFVWLMGRMPIVKVFDSTALLLSVFIVLRVLYVQTQQVHQKLRTISALSACLCLAIYELCMSPDNFAVLLESGAIRLLGMPGSYEDEREYEREGTRVA